MLRLRGIGLGPRGCEILARRGLGTELREVDLAENPLLGRSWQGDEHAPDAGTAFAGLCRRVLGVALPVGWHGLRELAPEPHESVGAGAATLWLQHTNVGPLAMAQLLEVAARRASLSELRLGGGVALGESGKRALAAAIVQR